MLNIKIPNACKNQQVYSLDVLINEFLGIKFKYEIYDGNVIEITNFNDLVKFSKLTLNINFFNKIKQHWLKTESMPKLDLVNWKPLEDGINAKLTQPSVPILFGSPGLIRNDNHIHLNLDIFGSAFLCLHDMRN